MPTESKENDERALVASILPSPYLAVQETANLLQRVLPGLSSLLAPSTAPACNLTAPPLVSELDCSAASPAPGCRGRPPSFLLDWCWRRVTCSAQQQCAAVASSAPQVFDARPLCMVVDAEPTRAGGAWARWRRLFSSSSRRMSSVPTDERTGTDLSRCLAGVTAPRARPAMGSMGNKDKPPRTMTTTHHGPATAAGSSSGSSGGGGGGGGVGAGGGGMMAAAAAAAAACEMNGHGRQRQRRMMLVVSRPLTLAELWQDERFLKNFFFYFTVHERRSLAQVCAKWRDVLYQPRFWLGLAPVLRCRELRGKPQLRKHLYGSMQRRGFDSVSLIGANDDDVYDMINSYPPCAKHVRRVALRCSAVSDKGMEILLEHMQCVCQLELSGCNEITEAGLWTCLTPRLVALSIADCINVADESVGAVAQLLPSLYEFNLQAYHVTDAALGYFSAKQAASLSILRLQSCWEVTNHGLVNIVHALPNLTVLSLSGCSKITDDGVELIAENLRHLRTLDLSWCPRITDAALEYIACDLTQLEELTLDRCVHITDIGIGYVSTMLSLTSLFLRWCTQIRDFGLQHLCSMRNLQVLSLAGCSLLTSSGLSSLIQLRHLQELELTNCPGASRELFDYLHEHLPKCLIIE